MSNRKQPRSGTVFKYRFGKIWYLRYAKETGRRRRSLKTTDEKYAEMVRSEEEHRMLFSREGIETHHVTPIPFSDFMRRYINHKRAESRGAGTLTNYLKALNRLGDHLNADIRVDQITRLTIEEHIRAMQDEGYTRNKKRFMFSKKTMRNEIMALVTAFRWAEEEGYTRTDPTKRIKLPKPVQYIPRPVLHDQYLKLMEKVDEKFRDVIRLFYLVGCRRTEATLLKFSEHVDFTRRILYIPQPKQGTIRTLFISDQLMEILQRLKLWANGSDRVLSIHKSDLSKKFRQYANEAGLPHNITLHSLRHSYGSNLAAAGTPILAVQRLMGHSDLRSTLIYAGAFEEDLRKAMERLTLPVEKRKN